MQIHLIATLLLSTVLAGRWQQNKGGIQRARSFSARNQGQGQGQYMGAHAARWQQGSGRGVQRARTFRARQQSQGQGRNRMRSARTRNSW